MSWERVIYSLIQLCLEPYFAINFQIRLLKFQEICFDAFNAFDGISIGFMQGLLITSLPVSAFNRVDLVYQRNKSSLWLFYELALEKLRINKTETKTINRRFIRVKIFQLSDEYAQFCSGKQFRGSCIGIFLVNLQKLVSFKRQCVINIFCRSFSNIFSVILSTIVFNRLGRYFLFSGYFRKRDVKPSFKVSKNHFHEY